MRGEPPTHPLSSNVHCQGQGVGPGIHSGPNLILGTLRANSRFQVEQRAQDLKLGGSSLSSATAHAVLRELPGLAGPSSLIGTDKTVSRESPFRLPALDPCGQCRGGQELLHRAV